jgi:hypothetical protein
MALRSSPTVRPPIAYAGKPISWSRSALSRLLCPRVLALAFRLHPVSIRKRLDRLAKPETLLLLHEAEHVAPGLAAKAVVELLPCIDRERRGALLVERAQPGVALAGAAQVGVPRDDLDDVGGALYALDRLGRELAARQSRDSSGSASRLKVAIQKRSVIPAM